MREAIGASLPFAVGVALSPIPIVAVVLMLATPGGRTNGLAFVAGWVIGLAIVGTIVLVASSGANASEGGEPARLGDRSQEILSGLRRWMALHNSAIMTVLIGVIGVKLVGDGIATV